MRDQLNRLDGVAGDGDLGLTVEHAPPTRSIELAPTLAALPEAGATGSAAPGSPAGRRRPAAR